MINSSLLEHELVKKYFECGVCDQDYHALNKGCPFMAKTVLEAMTTPIKKGEKYLGYFFNFEEWKVADAPQDNSDPFHPAMLRLPDSHQPQEKKCDCHPKHPDNCHCECHKIKVWGKAAGR